MQKNDLLKLDDEIIRVLEIKEDRVFVIPCTRQSMPYWTEIAELDLYTKSTEEHLLQINNVFIPEMATLSADSKRFVHEHFTLIAGILPYVSDEKRRKRIISKTAEEMKVSKQTIRYNLCLYLVYQDIAVLAPKGRIEKRKLTKDERNFRWALNKYYYNRNKNSLNTAYTMMLKEKYCDEEGVLKDDFPSLHQFKYFYRKHRKMQNYYISRNGLSNYQRNNRPLVGNGVQAFASGVGVSMLDATVCDIYLVNEAGNLVGRPVLTACIDTFSGLCCGYSLTLEGGTYSLRNLMLNVITDKVKWCKSFGINILKEDWDCDKLPAVMVTDMGREYISETFEQISEFGVRIINLPPYRPELKGSVEKFFDLIQEMYKPYLKGKGVIDVDYQERGIRDYRKDACLSMRKFEKIILKCILYYNSQRIIEDYPYTEDMLAERIKPYSSEIWNYGIRQENANLISVTKEQLIYTLLPRIEGRFTRYGLKVNGMRYHCEGFTEQYLQGGNVTVAYNPENTSFIWLYEKGKYTKFELIESRYRDKSLNEVHCIQKQQRELVKDVISENLQAKINLAEYINVISKEASRTSDVQIKNIRNTRKREQQKTHIDYLEEGIVNG